MQTAIERILLVDDDPDDAFLLGSALSELPVPIVLHSVDGCDELVAAARRFGPDLIFMDMNMPKKNGIECLALLQANALSGVPVVMYSSADGPELVHEAYAAGVSLFFRKPASFDMLVNVLNDVLTLDWSDPAAIRARFAESVVPSGL
ncbi:MAG: response regulator [Chitinophagaceae bacterium]|nr:MAG: response regulator [Chitinophagaceae bacterium]